MLHSSGYMWVQSTIKPVKSQHSRGFTIVELLIVVVVIAILAAITIVAYNGIQNRAKQSAAQSQLTQANKKILIYYTTNGDLYPDSLDAAGVNNSDNALQYTADNTSTPKKYGLTVTKDKISYYVSNTNATPTSGGYAGHGQGGVIAVTNRFQNPTYSGAAGPGNQTGTTNGLATYAGSTMAQATTTTSSAASIRLMGNAGRWAISEGQNVYASAVVYNASAGTRQFSMTVRFYDTASASSSGNEVDTVGGPGAVAIIPAGGSAILTASGTAVAGTLSAGLNVNRNSGTGAVSGDVYYVDNVFFSDTAAGFADGTTSNWVWNGVPNASTSTGPMVAL